MLATKLELQIADVNTLPLLPPIASQLLALSDDPSVGVKEYERIILQDPSLTARMLRMANSPYFGGAGRITSLRQALLTLGINVIRSVCITITFQSAMATRNIGRHFDKIGFWRHSLATACIAKSLARSTQYIRPEEAFIAGLLHDIGKLVIHLLMPLEGSEIARYALYQGISDRGSERHILGRNHEEAGLLAAERWEIPNIYWGAISKHHAPLDNNVEPDALALLVNLADTLTYMHDLGCNFAEVSYTIDPRVMEWLGLNEEQCVGCAENVRQEMAVLQKP